MFPRLASSRKARTLLIIGLLSFALFGISYSFSLTFGLSASPLHFLRGFLLGLSIVFILAAASFLTHNRSAAKS
ncbi:MAG: hypothetical protein WCC27_00990 [Acidobacteriaceae bacterium]